VSASIAEEIVETLRTSLSIVRHHRGAWRSELLRGYLAAQLRRARAGGKKVPGSLRLLGADVSYFNPEALAILVTEVLVDQAYYLDLPERPFIIDGGANIGLATLLFKRRHPHSQILAFEPDPHTHALCQKNITDNGLADVELVHAALSDREGELLLSVDPETPGNLGMSTRPVPSLLGRVSVPARTLSSFIKRRVDLLKLDIEGVEVDVLDETAASGALEQVDQIVMEYHHHVEPDEDRLGHMLALLEGHGFGYQVLARPAVPFRRGVFSSMFVYAYQKRTPAAAAR
jgi:FkbM family methyltransferase